MAVVHLTPNRNLSTVVKTKMEDKTEKKVNETVI